MVSYIVENTNAIVSKVTKLLKVEVKPEGTSTLHDLPVRPSRNNNRKPSVNTHAPFVDRVTHNKIFAKHKLTRNLDLEKSSIEGAERLFINENPFNTQELKISHSKLEINSLPNL